MKYSTQEVNIWAMVTLYLELNQGGIKFSASWEPRIFCPVFPATHRHLRLHGAIDTLFYG